MIARKVAEQPIKETAHGVDVRQMYNDASAQIMHMTLQPGETLKAHKTPVDVTFFILEGRPTVHVGEESIAYEANTLIESPAKITHRLSNESDAIARILVIKAPRPTSATKVL
ncbi:MAG: cupin domain-containing protein [Bacteroidales bacterium]|jgi:mannose-6-phosphate isomerase-like protein (cupin superfamily)|nr:cupin domain-containing protein [Bacteroidales bacterium]